MTTPLTLNIANRDGGTVALVATGEIDLTNVDTFSQAINDAIAGAGSGQPVTVDLSAVEYLDSGGINVLFTYADHIRVIVKPLLIPVLNISGLSELTTVEAAPGATN
jgi:anti-anti-sigma factor